ncbi:MAG TPA: hypothetical protein DCE41_23970, partial [Cytophagales bacterium]|nr:hypothetical protein [Cytophagales bacterium]
MASAPEEILQLFRQHYPPAKLSPEGWILLPKPQVAVVYQPLLSPATDLNRPPVIQIPEYLQGWSTRQLWEDHWLYKQPIVQSRLLSLIGYTERVHGRQTEARRIDQPSAKDFLDQNHILGGTKAKFKYGLFRGEELLAAATFSAGRTMTEAGREGRSYELIRTCNRLGTTVVGGVSKLIKAFVREHQPDDIMTYVTRDWSEGGMYEALGFERIANTDPQWLYVDSETQQRR